MFLFPWLCRKNINWIKRLSLSVCLHDGPPGCLINVLRMTDVTHTHIMSAPAQLSRTYNRWLLIWSFSSDYHVPTSCPPPQLRTKESLNVLSSGTLSTGGRRTNFVPPISGRSLREENWSSHRFNEHFVFCVSSSVWSVLITCCPHHQYQTNWTQRST